MSGARPEVSSSSQPRALAIAASSLDRVSELIARGSSHSPCAGAMISRWIRVGGFDQGATREEFPTIAAASSVSAISIAPGRIVIFSTN